MKDFGFSRLYLIMLQFRRITSLVHVRIYGSQLYQFSRLDPKAAVLLQLEILPVPFF